MDLKQLRYFISVAETGSISKSAVVLCISQPVLSRHLAALEAEFGFSLLFRNGRGVLLTDAGEKLLTAARAVMEDIRVLEGEMLALRQVPIGEAVIGIPPMLGDYLSVPLVKAFRQRFPRVSLQLVEGLSGHIHEWLVTGKLDVAILYNAPNNSIIMAEALLKDDLCLLGAVSPPAAEKHSIRFGDLAGLPLIMPSKPHGLRSIIENVANKLGVRLNAVNAESVARHNAHLHGGLAVVDVSTDSPAGKAGIQRGDILVGLHTWEMLTLDNVLFVLNHNDLATFNPLRFYTIRSGQVYRGWIQQVE